MPTFAIAGALLALIAAPADAKSRYASMVVDGHTGKVLYARNPDSPRFPASLTKIMTIYMMFEFLQEGRLDYDTEFVVTPHAAAQVPTKLGLKPGKTIRVVDAIRALVTKSANDAAAVVAENLAGTEENFAQLMTAKAHEIGMKDTTFRNASGLPNAEQVTTARDMITLARRIQSDFPAYYRFFRTKYFKYRGRSYRNHNGLLFRYRGTDGIKTGYTRASGFNLTASVRRGRKHLVAVVLGGRSAGARNAHMQQLLNRAFPKAVAGVRPSRVPMPSRNPRTMIAAAEPAPTEAGAAEQIDWEDPETIAAAEAIQIAEAEALMAETEKPVQVAVAAPGPRETRKVEGEAQPAVSKRMATAVGTFHVQVGAYASKSDATARLNQVSSIASDLLKGHPPLTRSYRKSKRNLYRARFAGFTKTAALGTCSKLQRRAIKCLVMRAE